MRNGNNRTDSCLSNNQENSSSYCEQHGLGLIRFLNVPVLVLLIAIIVAMIFPSGIAFGQYMVQPVELKLQSRVNKQINTALRIHSQEESQNLEIELKVVELSQALDSEWQIFEPDPNSIDYIPDFDVSKLSSCSDWIRLSTSRVELGPLAEVPVEVMIRVPPRVHGFYSAGILTTYRVRPEGSDVGYLLRYLIPVLIEIQGRTIQPKIKLLNVDMEHVPAVGEKEATTNIAVSVENIGDTYSRLQPMARLEGFQDGHWRLITRAEFRDTGIIPGVQLHLESDIMRSLPSGKYKLAGAIYIDGRPGGAIQKEIDFVGDPSLQKAATDAPLDLKPTEIVVNGSAGSTRTEILSIHNASDSTVNIQTLFALPTSLSGRTSPDFKGESLGCPDWLRIEPSQFELGSYQDKRVRVIAEIPATMTDYPWHYAVLGLYAHYPDGQMAGLTTANVCVGEDRGMTPDVMVKATNLNIRDYDPLKSEFLVLIEFTNYSSTFFTPKKCRAGIIYASGQYASQVRASTSMRSDQPGIILPLDTRRYSGVLDLSSVEAGNYRLEAYLEYGIGQNISKQSAIQVSIVNGRRTVTTIQTADEIAPNDIIEVNW
jgi:hypothetical protein